MWLETWDTSRRSNQDFFKTTRNEMASKFYKKKGGGDRMRTQGHWLAFPEQILHSPPLKKKKIKK